MSRRRALGLQGWLVAAFLAVGIVASLAVLLVVLPTLESNVQADRAKREASALHGRLVDGVRATSPTASADQLAGSLNRRLDADVKVIVNHQSGGIPTYDETAQEPTDSELVTMRGLPYDGSAALDGDRAVAATVRYGSRTTGDTYTVIAVRELSGVDPELAIVRRRVIVAMAVVLALAALAGVVLARIIGGRTSRLASTAATLARGDLAARAPDPGVAPLEIVTLGDSLNGMAGRLESLVAEITSERDRDRAMIGSLAEGVLAVGPDGSVTLANDAAVRYLRLPEDLSRTRLETLPHAVMDAVLDARRVTEPGPVRREVALPWGLELELSVARIGDEPAGGTVIALRDVTEERRLDRARRDLVANVSHELKTPIAALKGFLELLEGDRVDERHRREFLASMSQETDRLERLVEEQLQLARLDAGALPLEREELDLGELAAQVVRPRRPLAERDGIALTAPPPAAEVVVQADPARIEQILLILIDNALKHTAAGGAIEVVVGREDGDATVAVRDTGEGIAPDAQPFVFDRFYRGDPSREGRSAGLGLAIARGLARAHGGTIDLRSRLGEGSTFTLRLPGTGSAAITEESPVPDALRPGAPGTPGR
ncbi:MAG: ATP-binding protein [Thermoleophilia bacterium]